MKPNCGSERYGLLGIGWLTTTMVNTPLIEQNNRAWANLNQSVPLPVFASAGISTPPYYTCCGLFFGCIGVDSGGVVRISPTIGAAIRLITSDLVAVRVPVPIRMANRYRAFGPCTAEHPLPGSPKSNAGLLVYRFTSLLRRSIIFRNGYAIQ